jgi:hypothetical protein
MGRKLQISLVVLLLTAAFCFAAQKSKILLNEDLGVKRGTFKEVHFLIPQGGKEIRGNFKTTGGMNDDVTFLAVSQENYVKWLSGYPYKALYEVEKKKEGKFVVPVKPEETYYFVMDNYFSSVSNKNVKLRLELMLEK